MPAALLIGERTQISINYGPILAIDSARRGFYTCGSASNKCRGRFFTIYQVTCVGTYVRCTKNRA